MASPPSSFGNRTSTVPNDDSGFLSQFDVSYDASMDVDCNDVAGPSHAAENTEQGSDEECLDEADSTSSMDFSVSEGGSEQDSSDDEEINPFFNIYSDDDGNEREEEESVEDPMHEDTVEFTSAEIAGVEFGGRRPKVWAGHLLPTKIRKKPLTSIMKCCRNTYCFAVMFGSEQLNQIKELDFGKLSEKCPSCAARYWPSEITIAKKVAGLDCCQYGRYTIPQESVFQEPAQHIQELYAGTSDEAKNFQSNALLYNKLFSTAFVSGDFQNVGSTQHGLWSLKINGEVRYHNHSYRHDGDENRPPNHGQLYFLDFSHDTEDEIIMQRLQGLKHTDNLLPEVLSTLERYLRSQNKFVKAFKFTAEVAAEEERKAAAEGRPMQDVMLVINPKRPSEKITAVPKGYINRMLQSGQYTINPCDDFIGAVFTGDIPPVSYDAIYFPREQRTDERPPGRPQPFQRTLDIQMLPLIHLHGEGAWAVDTKKPTFVPSLADYAKLRLGVRDESFSVIHHGKKLLAYFLITTALKVEYDRLQWAIVNQKTLRSETYVSLRRYVETQAANQKKRVGRVIVLPKSMRGSYRYMKDMFYDSVAMSQELGQPSWFVTLTCNTHWPEITEECARTNTDPNFRYDLANRAFDMRQQVLHGDIVREQILGRVKGFCTVKEYQGRGRTHMHHLYIMDPADRPTCPADIDRVIWAFFPDKTKHPVLYDLVVRYMVHSPCLTPNSPCRQGRGRCKAGFPFELRDTTDISGKRPLYRRPNDGGGYFKVISGQRTFVDNRWVVPYNPVLLLRLGGHVNIMYCPSTSACKYFYGYVLKGSFGNKVRISISRKNAENTRAKLYDHDEIEEYKEMRHFGAYEAYSTIMGKPLAEMYPPVEVLGVHLEGEEAIIYNEGNEESAVARHTHTKLTAWFELNKSEGPHRGKLYKDVVKFYSFKNGVWTASNRHTIGRLMPVSLTVANSELFHLRLLLCNRPDAQSYAQLRTVNGYECADFKEACTRLNLVPDEGEIDQIIDDLIEQEFPACLRRTFALILINVNPVNPRRLWDKYKLKICEDYLQEDLQEEEEIAFALGLKDIHDILQDVGKTLLDYGLPEVPQNVLDVIPGMYNSRFVSQSDANDLVSQLNIEQRAFFDAVIAAVNKERQAQRLFFLTGPGGTGKTFTYNCLISFLNSRGKSAVACAFSGIAATLLIGGMTSHRAFGLPLEDEGLGMSRSSLKVQSRQALALKEASIILWDEVSMAGAFHLHVVDKLLRDLMQCPHMPFGNKVIILGGDFRQVLPTVVKGSRADIVDAAITSSNLWPLFKIYHLTINQRAVHDAQYANWILRVGEGRENSPRSFEITLPRQYLVNNLDALIKHCFGAKIEKEDRYEAAILCPTNEAVRSINAKIMEIVCRQPNVNARTYLSSTRLVYNSNQEDAEEGTNVRFPEDYLYTLESASIQPHSLTVAQGVMVMLMRNLQVGGGLCNGTRLKVLHCLNNVIICEVLGGKNMGQVVPVFRVTINNTEFGLPGTLRHQFPVKVCFAITINKGQGTSLKREGLYLTTAPFVHGQVYVAVSRVGSRDALRIAVLDGPMQGRKIKQSGMAIRNCDTFTQNPIYVEVLKGLYI